ncbi:MAG: XRE family transcriptional regulator [Desulfohalobiaceae bacterium]|nr:XRE family transcriptional regulator [Desulfohalobiaceae bacterium]
MQGKDKTPYVNVDYFEDLTGDIEESPEQELQEVGSRMRQLRRDKGLSLQELSRLAGIDTKTLSRIEEGELQPQLGTVLKLSKSLEGDLGTLISGQGDKPYAITRKSERKRVIRSNRAESKQAQDAYKSLAPEVQGRHMEPLMVRLRPDPEEEPSVHQGEEFIFVLEGTVLLKMGQERFELEPGDSAYYQSSQPHHVAAANDSATILAVIYEAKREA